MYEVNNQPTPLDEISNNFAWGFFKFVGLSVIQEIDGKQLPIKLRKLKDDACKKMIVNGIPLAIHSLCTQLPLTLIQSSEQAKAQRLVTNIHRVLSRH